MTQYVAIDMGSGAMRTLYARMGANGVPVVEGRKNYRYFLADDIRNGMFSAERMAEVVDACAEAIADIRASGATFVGATATEAFRLASNGTQLMEMVRQQTGLQMQIISSEDELRMSYQGAAPYIHPQYNDIIFADSGGGSTEMAHISHQQGLVHGWTSLKLGLVTHLHEMGDDDITTPARFDYLKSIFKDIILTNCNKYEINLKNKALVIAGAPMFLTAYLNDLSEKERADYQAPGEYVGYDTIEALARKVCAMGKDGRANDPLIGKNRFETFVPATAKCMALMEVCGVEGFQAVPSGLALALIVQHVSQSESESA